MLVAGYPADELQKAFNQLQKSKKRDLRKLPGMPPDMPDSYFELLEQMLTYRHKNRKAAHEILDCEFVRFHQEMSDGEDMPAESANDIGLSLADVAATAAAGGGQGSRNGSTRNGSTREGTTKSILIEGSVRRHAAYLEYGKFERALTTLLATVLDVDDLTKLIGLIDEHLEKNAPENPSFHGKSSSQDSPIDESTHSIATSTEDSTHVVASLKMSNQAKLQVMRVQDVRKLLLANGFNDVADMVADLPSYSSYSSFAYHVELLRVFVREKKKGIAKGSRERRPSAFRKAHSVFSRENEFDISIHSDGPSSVHGGNVWQSISRQKNKPMARTVSSDELNRSTHF